MTEGDDRLTVWHTADGRHLTLQEMDTAHLRNSLRFAGPTQRGMMLYELRRRGHHGWRGRLIQFVSNVRYHFQGR